MNKTILGIGAHYDDCVFGILGVLLKAVRKNYRVIVLSMVGDYRNWSPARGCEKEIVQGTIRVPSTVSFRPQENESVALTTKRIGQLTGQRFGRYEVRRLVGKGGMGTVYEAHDSKMQRIVALKLPRLELSRSNGRRATALPTTRRIDSRLVQPRSRGSRSVGKVGE